ncbi:tripartite tricarboxylate transporter TctB family protein [Mesorhizobium sp. YR577]|uniref:tripartite tricarboxylate transporter TctB family protein n=1 Tax=Mesorhizobium sp. YR577 TaxID=1884373 RepID=UPI0008F37BC6|nr:tripartite tricarboxylate transporter TctB family protein [Mesorhizobium sp. YR577]SFU18830.1 Tripartite tricarboxylate transporter TctB family protein [Mesorhizobium sp. YR577]
MAGIVTLVIASAGAMIYSLLHYDIWSFGMPASGLMPLVGCAIVLCASLWVAVVEAPHPKTEVSRPSLAYFAGFVAVLPLTALFGLLPALFVVAVALLRFVEWLPLPRALAVAAVVSVSNWIVFQKLLGVPLPHGSIWSTLWMS